MRKNNADINIAGDKISTPQITLPGWGEGELKTFWDVKGVPVGKYDAEVTLHYADGSHRKTVPVEVTEEISKEAVVEQPIQQETGINLPIMIILGIVLLFLLLNIILWWHMRRENEQ